MKVTNENLLRGCIQEAQQASVSLNQAILEIGTCAIPRSPREAQIFRLLKSDAQAINLLLSAIELTREDEASLWQTN